MKQQEAAGTQRQCTENQLVELALPSLLALAYDRFNGRLTGFGRPRDSKTSLLKMPGNLGDGISITILRIHIDALRSTGLSFMPEGLEKQVDLDAMTDLLAYLATFK